jgi:hypothetical protein
MDYEKWSMMFMIDNQEQALEWSRYGCKTIWSQQIKEGYKLIYNQWEPDDDRRSGTSFGVDQYMIPLELYKLSDPNRSGKGIN